MIEEGAISVQPCKLHEKKIPIFSQQGEESSRKSGFCCTGYKTKLGEKKVY